jgi:hypothetical protein
MNARRQPHPVLRELMRIPCNEVTSSKDVIPACFGTPDEALEVLTLVLTGKCAPIPLVLVDEPGGTYWSH